MPSLLSNRVRLAGVVVVAVSTAGLLAAPGSACADDAIEQARVLFRRGIELFAAGELEAAATSFSEAYALHPDDAIHCDLGVVLERLGKFVEAAGSLDRCLRAGAPSLSEAAAGELRGRLAELRRRFGRLRVVAEPAGAMVLVDGVVCDARQAIYVAPGTHDVSARRAGYASVSRTLALREGEEVAVPFTLERLGSVRVDCALAAVSVFVDGELRGATPLARAVEVSPGRHQLKLDRAGYAPFVTALDVSPGSEPVVECSLVPLLPLPPELASSLTVEVDEAQLFIDGQPLPADGVVPQGPHRVEARREGFRSESRDVSLAPGAVARLTFDLLPTPEWAERYVARANLQRGAAFVVGGAGLGAAIAAVAVAVAGEVRFNAWEAEQAAIDGAFATFPEGTARAALDARQALASEEIAGIRALDRATWGLAAGGAAALGAGLAMFFTAGDPDRYGVVEAHGGPDSISVAWTGPW